MGELFDRIKAIKVNRKYLTISLICTEILGIIVLIWFLRIPLSQKFLKAPPKAYSVVSMNPKKQYLVRQGDFLTGTAIPKTRVAILITPSNKKTFVEATDKGNWYYQLPENLDVKKYHFSIANLDKNNKIVFLKTYQFRVTYNNRISEIVDSIKKKLYPIFQKILPQARAQYEQDFQTDFGDNFSKWAAGLQTVGVYVYCQKDGQDSTCEEGSDVFLTDYDGILSYCNELNKPCYLPQRSNREIVSSAKTSSQEFIYRLLQKTDDNKYNISVLLDYFPDLASTDDYETLRKQQRKGGGYKNDISEAELSRLIQEVVNDLGWYNLWWDNNFGDPVKSLITLSDPIFGTRAIIIYFEKGNFNKLTYEEQNNFLLAIALVPAPIKKGSVALHTVAASAEEVARMGKLAKEAITDSKALPLRSVREMITSDWYILPTDSLAGLGKNLPANTSSLPKNYPMEATIFWSKMIDLSAKNTDLVAFPADKRGLQPVMDDLIKTIEALVHSGEIRPIFLDKKVLHETIENDWVIVVMSEFWDNFYNDSADAFTKGRSVFLKSGVITDHLLAHEFIHVISGYLLGPKPTQGKFFTYAAGFGAEKPSYEIVMSFLYELGTDDLATKVYPHTQSPYQRAYPQLYDSLINLTSFLEENSIGSFKRSDLMEFALTLDDGVLLQKLVGKEDPELFMKMLEGKIDLEGLRRAQQVIPETPETTSFASDLLTNLGFRAIVNSWGYAQNDILLTTPPLYKEDISIFKGEILQQSPIFLQITSSYVNDQVINVSTLISQYGLSVENSNLSTRWYLEDINQNRIFLEEKAETCLYNCTIFLPQDLAVGDYKLIVELVSPERADPIANASTTITVSQETQSPAIESIASQAFCEYEEWETEYECKNGQACYNLFYSSNQTSCQPQTRHLDNGDHYRCVPDDRCKDSESGDEQQSNPSSDYPLVPGVE